jgi:hypothetical protein
MAITIRQAPTTPNQANADLLYVLTSTNIAKPQFQYVMEIGGLTLKQQGNPTGRGVFNIGQITRDLVSQDNLWKTPNVQTITNTADTITPVFYEEYGTSISSSVQYYNGVSGSALYIMNGVVQPNDGSFNFDYDSYWVNETTPTGGGAGFTYQHALTNSPLTQSIREDEYATISIINGNFDGDLIEAQDVYWIQVNFYNESGGNISNFGFYNVDSGSYNGGPRTNPNQEWDAASALQTDGTKVLYIGVGPKNFTDGGESLGSGWAYYEVTLQAQESAGVEDNTAYFAKRRFVKQEKECDYDGTRFAFVNSFGVYDYFTFPFANSKQDTIERLTFEQGFVNYSTNANSVTYDKSRRGTKVFSLKSNETRTAESGYLSQEEADWLVELVESNEVYIQEGNDFLPVVIQNATFDYKTNPRTQKLYRLSLTYTLANQKRGI